MSRKSKVLRSCIALLLAIVMVVGMLPAGALAAEPEQDRLVYVSIGDSMTNGYGLDGYNGSSGIVNYGNDTYANKFAAWLAGYEGQITDDQVIFEGDNYVVDHRQLAMSGMRAEDIHWALELDYKNEALMEAIFEKWYNNQGWQNEVENLWYGDWGFTTGDYRTWTDLCDGDYRYADGAAKILAVYNTGNNGNYFTSSYADETAINNAKYNIANYTPYFPCNQEEVEKIGGYKYLQIATEFFQESVKDADVISLALGNTNFGTYMLNEIMAVIMYEDASFPTRYDIENVYNLAGMPEVLEGKLRGLIDDLDGIIELTFADLVAGDEAKMDALKNIIVFCTVSYLVNYIGSIDAILTLNEKDHLDIIQVALMNAYADEENVGDEAVTLGDIVDIIYTPINAFLAALPTYMQLTGKELYKNATFYYAEADTVGCMVQVYGDDFYKDAQGNYVEYPELLNGDEGYTPNPNSTVRDRFIENFVGSCACYYKAKGEDEYRWHCEEHGCYVDINENHAMDEHDVSCENGNARCRHCSGSVWNILDGLMYVNIHDIADYDMMTPAQKAAFAAENADLAKSCALYLAFENATIHAGEGTVTMDSLAALSADVGEVFLGIIGTLEQKATAYGMANYLGDIYTVVAAGASQTMTKTVNEMIAAYGVAVELIVSKEQIAKLVTTDEDADVCAEIAKSAEEAIIQAMRPLYVKGVVDKVYPGIMTLLNGINAFVTGKGVAGFELTAGGYYDYCFDSNVAWEETEDQKLALVKNFYWDANNANGFCRGYLAGYVNETLKAIEDADAEDAISSGYFEALGLTGAAVVAGVYNKDDQTKALLDAAATASGTLRTDEDIAAATGTFINEQMDADLYEMLAGKIYAVMPGSVEKSVSSLGYLLGLPQSLSDIMVENEILAGILCMNSRCLIGTGIGGHPSPAGHESLYQAIKASYENGYTSEDKTDDNIGYEDLPVVKAIIAYLTQSGYLSDEQIADVAFYAYELLKDGMVDGEEVLLVDYVYETLFGADIEDSDRIAIIGNVYAILNDYYQLSAGNTNLQAFENIVVYLYDNEYITDEQAFAIVNFVYWTVHDGIEGRDIFDIIKFVYLALFENEYPVLYGELPGDYPDPSLDASEKMEILLEIYNQFKTANPEIVEENPELEIIEELYEELTEENLLSDEQIFEIIDTAVQAIVVDEKSMEEAAKEVANEVTEQIEELPADKQLEVLKKVSETVEKMGEIEGGVIGSGSGSASESMAVIAEFNKYLDKVQKVIEALKAEDLWTGYADDKFSALTGGLITKLMNGEEIDPIDVIDDAYAMLLNQPGHTLEQKIRIVQIIVAVLESEGVFDAAIDYVDDNYYQEAIKQILTAENVELALGYIEAAIEAVKAAQKAVAEYGVDAEFAAVKEALLGELGAVEQTLKTAYDVLKSGDLKDLDGVWATMLTLKGELDNHIAKITALAKEIGIAAAPYIAEALGIANEYIALVETVINETYASLVNGYEEFVEEYAAWVEEMGKLADQVDPVLGAAVRKYLTETPAEALAILYAYGDEALTKLMVDAAAAGKDVYTIAAALAKLFYEYGEEIYGAVATDENYTVVADHIEKLTAEIKAVLAQIAAAPADSVSNYETVLSGLYAELMAAYEDIYPIVLAAAGQVEATLPGQIDALMTALVDALDVVGEAAGAYGSWFVDHAEAMAGALLASLVENTDELLTTACPIIDAIIWNILTQLDQFIDQVVADVTAQINYQLNILEQELEELKKQLQTAAGELREQIQHQITVVEGKINELKALIEKGIREDLPAILAAMDDLCNEVTELVKALKKAAMDEAAAAIEGIKNALAALEAALPEIVTDAIKQVTDLVAAFARDVVDTIVAAVEKYAPELADDIYDYLYNNPAEVIAFVKEYGPWLLALAEEYGDEVMAIVGGILYLYGEDIAAYVVENADEILATFVEWWSVHGENTWALILVYLEELGVLDCIQESVSKGTAAIREALDELKEALAEVADKIDESVMAEIQRLIANIEGILDELDDLKNASAEEIAAKLEELGAAIRDLLAAIDGEISETIDGIVAELVAVYEKVAAEVKAVLDMIPTAEDIENALAAVKELLEDMTAEAVAAIVEAIQDVLDELKEALAEVAAEIDAAVRAEIEELIAEVEAILADIAAGVYENIEEALTELGETLEELLEAAANVVDETVQDILDKLYEIYVDATTDEYEITGDSYYVALGDGTAVSESYVDALAAELGIEFLNLAAAGLTAQTTFPVIGANAEEIAKADLITLGYSSATMVEYMNEQMYNAIMGEAVEDPDWAAYVGEAGVPHVEAVLAEVRAKLVEQGLDMEYMGMNVIDLLMVGIESYAYAYVGYAMSYPELINAIRTVNEDALIIIVGMYNPLADMVLVHDGIEIPVGEYLDVMVEILNQHSTIYAMLTGEAIFVAAPDVETDNTKTEMNLIQFVLGMFGGGIEMYPNAEGHEYIKDQIINALTVTVGGLLGDVDGNGVVDSDDAMWILKYDVGTEVDILVELGDVDGNGTVDSDDAMWILKYDVGIETEYPIGEVA